MSDEPDNRGLNAVVVGSVVIFLAGVGLCGWPSAEWPLPITGLVLPLLYMLGTPLIGLPLVAGLLVVLIAWWFIPVARRRAMVTTSSLVWLTAAFLASFGWYVAFWKTANTWRRPTHAFGCALISLGFMLVTAILGVVAARRRSEMLSVIVRGLAVLWAGTYGFAYFGELP